MNNIEFVKASTQQQLVTPILSGYIAMNKESQMYKSMAGQQTAFLEFLDFMFAMSDAELIRLQAAFKKYVSDFGITQRDSVYTDHNLLKDAIDYQIVARDINGNQDFKIGEEIAISFNQNKKNAASFPKIDSKHLIWLAEDILSKNIEPKQMAFDQLEKIGIGLFGQSWQAQLADALNVDRRNVQNWKKQGVAKWVYAELSELIKFRKAQILAAETLYQSIDS